MDKVLERLQALQAELAAIDPAHDLDVADKVASIAVTFRDTLASVDRAIGRPVAFSPSHLILSEYRRAG
jgi:hypothetical protein